MQVLCSNCNTAHEVTQEQAGSKERSIIHCSRCDKRIKLQFCPHCGSFYSITFSNIKSGRYKYRCRKCSKDFAIEFNDEPAVTREKPISLPSAPVIKKTAIDEPYRNEAQPAEHSPAEKIEVAGFIHNSINSFSINELFSAAAGAFSPNRLTVSSIGAAIMLLLMWTFSIAEGLWFSGRISMHPFAGSAAALLPLAIIFSFYTATAAVVARVTLDQLFFSRRSGADEIIGFTMKTGWAVFAGNVFLLITISALLILFGRIPLLGPVLFAIAFLPVYLSGIMIFLLCFIGTWFYPPIAAHREGGIFSSMKSLIIFIKKHNLSLLYMIPVIILVSAIVLSAVFIIHTSAFSLSISLSKWLISSDGGGVFSSIPASFVKATEATISGLGSGLFRQLSVNTGMTEHLGGFILGSVMIIITVVLIAISVSVTATVSTHIYIVMERGLTIDDKKKGGVFLILILMLSLILILKSLFR